MGVRISGAAFSIPIGVLLILTGPVSANDDKPIPSSPEEAVDTASSTVDELKGDASREAEEARAGAQEKAEGIAEKAEAGAGDARLTAEAAVIFVVEIAIEVYHAAWDLAVDVADTVFETIYPVLRDDTRRGDLPWDATRNFSTETVVVEPREATVVLWVAAASTGVAFAVIWLLRRLATIGAIPLLSRIAHSEIYNNEARRTINELVVAEAGLCLNELVTRTGYSRNAVSYHLFVLEKEEAIVSVKDGKYRRYFTRNGKYVNGAKNVVSALRNETTLKLARAVLGRPGAIQRDLCVELGATPSATCWHAKRLLDVGVIRKERVANTVQYFPGEALAKYDLSEFGLGATPAPQPAQ